jgi:peptidoglycan L-alanyl-D-glutamate endopeptidase CwlK
MSRDLELLTPEFGEKVQRLLSACKEDGYTLVPFYTVRDVWCQARMWRQSRSWTEIKRAITDLKAAEAHWIAEVLEGVGPQYGRWATNALPGLSWHQYGVAVDCFVLENKRAIWKDNHPGYITYAREAIKLNLGCGYYWSRPDPVHVQQWAAYTPVLSTTDWATINEMMYAKWGITT